MPKAVNLTLTRLYRTIRSTAFNLSLTERCYEVTNSFADFVSVVFVVPRPTADDVVVIRDAFAELGEQYGWLASAVAFADNNTVRVSLIKGGVFPARSGQLY
jgi:hypothetical protein